MENRFYNVGDYIVSKLAEKGPDGEPPDFVVLAVDFRDKAKTARTQGDVCDADMWEDGAREAASSIPA